MHIRTVTVGACAAAVSAVALTATVATAPAGAARAKPVVKDGSFVNPAQPSITTFNRSDRIGPWKVAAGTVDVNPASSYALPETVASNGQSVDLNGTDAGALRQTVKTVPGTTYSLSYYLGGNPDGDPGLKTVTVSVDNAPVETAEFDSTNSTADNIGWQPESASFTATSTRSVLVFASDTPGTFYGPLVTGIAASPVVDA